jgi:hypothetical protein
MGRRKKIKCKSCGEALFYLPSGYDMSFTIKCCSCEDNGNGKKKLKKKLTKDTAAAKYACVKRGKRPDVHPTYTFRSATEANFARILTLLEIKYKFEERVFAFYNTDYKKPPWQYIPDFEITKGINNMKKGWYEIKGWMNVDSRQKLRRFRQRYPEEAAKLTVVLYRSSEKKNIEFCKKLGYKVMFYDQLTKEFAAQIPTWEG